MIIYNWRTYSDLANTIRNNIHKLPEDIDLIVGVPRSGIIPAYMIALFLNKKACSIDEYLSNMELHSGERIHSELKKKNRKVLIVDDSVHSGVSIDKVKQRIAIKKHQIIGDTLYFCAIYAKEEGKALVDFYFEKVDTPRLFQWNYLNHSSNSKSCFDMDGVLCKDPEPWQNDDGEKYEEFLKTAKPLFIPSYKIKAIVTSRLEKYRKQTERWLKEHNVKYEKLYMLNLPSKEERIRLNAHGTFKSEIYNMIDDTNLFIESNPKQAKEICKLSKKPVICVETDEMFLPILDNTDLELRKNKFTLDNKRILLCSHELTYTGAPHSLLRICKVLKKYGAEVEVWSRCDGIFKREFEKLNVFVRIVPDKDTNSEKIKEKIATFDCAIVNTVIYHKMFLAARDFIPCIWYIREAHNLPEICDNTKDRYRGMVTADELYCVSEYAKDFIENKYNKKVKVVHNCVEDNYTGELNIIDNKINIAVIGTLTHRKAFDICLDAFERLSEDNQNKCQMFFAGQLIEERKDYWGPILKRVDKNKNITYVGEIKNIEEKIAFYKNMNVIVVVSRDESCSLVVLEGAMMGKPVIVSENVGAKYIVNDKCGWIVETENVLALKEVFEKIINNPAILTDMGIEARKSYEKTSTMEIYEKNIIDMINTKIKYDFRQKYLRMSQIALAHQLERKVRDNEKILSKSNDIEIDKYKVHIKDNRLENIIDKINNIYIVRKVKGGICCYKEHGLRYTLRRILQKCKLH